MSTGEFITAIIMFLVSGVLLILAILHFMERGYLFNNAYIYASREQRDTMNKKPYYRQSAIVFLILCIVFIVIGLSVVLQNSMIILGEIPLFIAVMIYAIVSSAKIKDGSQL